jgi:predicted TIM-barrel fold metal-dependent hydrolase
MRTAGVLASLSLIACAHESAHYQGPIFDTHVHVNSRAGQHDDSPEAMERRLAEAGVAQAGLINIARRGLLEQTRESNDAIAALVIGSPGRYFGFGSVHPDDGEAALMELDRMVKVGLRGLKLHPNSQRFDVASPSVDRVVKRAAALRMVVLFDSYSPFDPAEIGKFITLAIANPDARIVLAHMGGPRFREILAFAALKYYPQIKLQVWFDLSYVAHIVAGSPSLSDELRHICRQVGVDRVLFASDFPLISPKEAIADVRALGFTPDEERQIFHDNAAALFTTP